MSGMATVRLIAQVAAVLLVGCQNGPATQVISASLKNTELFQHPTVGGDEEGARIVIQATHFSLSEIRRDATTGFVATYVYRAAPGFVGTDHSEIEVSSGSDGASSPKRVTRIVFRFVIHD